MALSPAGRTASKPRPSESRSSRAQDRTHNTWTRLPPLNGTLTVRARSFPVDHARPPLDGLGKSGAVVSGKKRGCPFFDNGGRFRGPSARGELQVVDADRRPAPAPFAPEESKSVPEGPRAGAFSRAALPVRQSQALREAAGEVRVVAGRSIGKKSGPLTGFPARRCAPGGRRSPREEPPQRGIRTGPRGETRAARARYRNQGSWSSSPPRRRPPLGPGILLEVHRVQVNIIVNCGRPHGGSRAEYFRFGRSNVRARAALASSTIGF